MVSPIRMSGLSSGLDTDQLIKDLMKAEKLKSTKVEALKTRTLWQQEGYRNIINKLRTFSDSFFDVLKPTTNLRSSAFFGVMQASVTSGGVSSTALSATVIPGTAPQTVTIDRIEQLALADKWTSSTTVSAEFSGSVSVDLAALDAAITAGNKAVTLTVDGNTKTIDLTGGYSGSPTGHDDLVAEMTTKLNAAFGIGGGGQPTFAVTHVAGKVKIGHSEQGHKMTISGSAAAYLSFSSGQSNTVSMSNSLSQAFGVAANQKFKINGVEFDFSATTKISDMMIAVNQSSAKVRMTYSELTNKFSFQSTETGGANQLTIEDTDGNTPVGGGAGFLASSLKISSASRVAGQDAIFTMNGITTSRTSNSFTIDGLQLTLNAEHKVATPIQIGITTGNMDGVVDKIKNIVKSYNELIGEMSGAITEKKRYEFAPLTEEEKDAMSEEEVKLWETKAKQGQLRSDPLVSKVLDSLRTIFYEPVAGLNISMRDIGITTSNNYLENGKLVLDETKLRDALTNKPNDVIELFTKESSQEYLTGDRTIRKTENGIANRIYDVLQDSVRTTRDSNGKKGWLIEKAGLKGDSSDVFNDLQKKVQEYDKRLTTMLKQLNSKEQYYYSMFTNLEKSMSMMDSQMKAFTSQLGAS